MDENTKRLQDIATDILKCFHDTCEENDIRYSLAYGTMLGAVRHGGFIPWDDDVDVFMTYEEYEKFKNVFKSDKYELLDWDIDKDYPYLFPKLRKRGTTLIERDISELNYNIGAYIDLFVLYPVPDGILGKIKNMRFFINYKLYRLKELNLSAMGTATRAVARIAKPFLRLRRLIVRLNKIFRKSRGDLMRDVSILDRRYFIKTEYMNDLVKIPFGDLEVYVFRNAHEVLTNYYGDYMQLPPEDRRVSVHNFYKLDI